MLNLKKHPHYLSVSVSYKQDPWNLIEWLEYHLIVGVDHFYIYNNDESPIYSNAILQSYVDDGIVTVVNSARLFHKTRFNRQADAHTAALNQARGRTRWLAMLDMDEFMFPMQLDKVSDVLRHYEEYPQLIVNYCCFGSSGHAERPPLQTRAYIHRSYDRWEWNALSKSIGHVPRITHATFHHYWETMPGWGSPVDEHKRVCFWYKQYTGSILRINHYLSRSVEDYHVKLARGNPLGERRDWNWFRWADRNEVFDDSLWRRYGDRILEAIDRRKTLWYFSKGKLPLL